MCGRIDPIIHYGRLLLAAVPDDLPVRARTLYALGAATGLKPS